MISVRTGCSRRLMNSVYCALSTSLSSSLVRTISPIQPGYGSSEILVYFYLPDERPAHHVKLYQYSSGNVEEILQRHSRVSSLIVGHCPCAYRRCSTAGRRTSANPTTLPTPLMQNLTNVTMMM